jgi:Protein of unknown function (DUF559)
MDTPDQLLSARTRQQRGVASDAQARADGLSQRQIQRRVATGRLERFGPRSLVAAGAPVEWEQRLLAALLSAGDSAVVSGRAAAALLGLDGFPPRPIELTVPRGRHPVRRGWTVHTSTCLEPIDITTFGPFRCTTAARTIIDLAGWRATGDQLEAAIGSALRLRLTSELFLRQRLLALRKRGRRGVRRLDGLLDGRPFGHTFLERRFVELVRAAGLPIPRTQVVFRSGSRVVARVDALFEDRRVVVEVAGQKGHTTSRERQVDDQRRTELQLRGYRVLTFTYEDVMERPAWVVECVRQALAVAWTSVRVPARPRKSVEFGT